MIEHGNIFAVNYVISGHDRPHQPRMAMAQVFVELPNGSIGNGIRFAPDGTFFVADYTGHNVLRVDPKTREVSVHAHHGEMNQPNDLALSHPTARRCTPATQIGPREPETCGVSTTTAKSRDWPANMGTTNGIEVSPDGKTLYVNESKQRNVWAFTITEKQLN